MAEADCKCGAICEDELAVGWLDDDSPVCPDCRIKDFAKDSSNREMLAWIRTEDAPDSAVLFAAYQTYLTALQQGAAPRPPSASLLGGG